MAGITGGARVLQLLRGVFNRCKILNSTKILNLLCKNFHSPSLPPPRAPPPRVGAPTEKKIIPSTLVKAADNHIFAITIKTKISFVVQVCRVYFSLVPFSAFWLYPSLQLPKCNFTVEKKNHSMENGKIKFDFLFPGICWNRALKLFLRLWN